jgi:tetraacyldisaccharide 4'-kinase
MNGICHMKRAPLLSPTGFRDIVSGRRRGAAATMLRGILALAEVPYSWAVRRRNARYDRGANRVHRVEVPVISVGNLTLGGTGKTPMVEWIVQQFLQQQNKKVGIVSRGYGARGRPNDEALELAWKLPGVPHVQNPDRLAAAHRAIDQFGCEALVLDDAFQHRRLARDLDIVLLDALEPLGFEHVFPRGTLREPLAGLSRAQVIALSRADLMPAEERASLRARAATLSPMATWVEVVHAPLELVAMSDGMGKAGGTPAPQQPLESLRGRRVLAFCGLGNPAGFRHTLATCGYEVADFREFPDHHQYSQTDLDSLAAAAQQMKAEAVVCTQKDLVKINRDRLGDRPLWAVRVGIDFLSGREEFVRRLLNARASPL